MAVEDVGIRLLWLWNKADCFVYFSQFQPLALTLSQHPDALRRQDMLCLREFQHMPEWVQVEQPQRLQHHL